MRIDLQLILRGLAAFWVMYWHFIAAYIDNIFRYILIPGRTAVWIFFGLSGYVIFYGFESGKYQLWLSDLRRFYRNRFLRIYPLFILGTFSVLLIKFLKNQTLPTLDINFFLTQILAIQYFHIYDLNGVFWTLGIEMWFYLFAPFFYFLLRSVHSIKIAIAIYVFLLFLVAIEIIYFKSPDVRTLTSNLCHFYIGFIAVRFGPRLYTKLHWSNISMFSLALMAFLFSGFCMGFAKHFSGFHPFFTFGILAVDAGILLVLMLQPTFELKTNSSLLIKGLILLGTISYGVYVWHQIVFLAFIDINIHTTKVERYITHGLMILTLMWAWFIYKFYESRFLSHKKYKVINHR